MVKLSRDEAAQLATLLFLLARPRTNDEAAEVHDWIERLGGSPE